MGEWDYNTEYCDGCAELGLTSCSCEPDGYECSNCGAEMTFDEGECEECQEENEFGL